MVLQEIRRSRSIPKLIKECTSCSRFIEYALSFGKFKENDFPMTMAEWEGAKKRLAHLVTKEVNAK